MIMFKTLINTILLFILLLGNMALYTWCINQMKLGEDSLEKTLINTVQADAVPVEHLLLPPETIPQVIHEQPIKQKVPTLQRLTTAPDRKNLNQRIVLHFQPTANQLSKTEKEQLEGQLQKWAINSLQAVQVIAGPAPTGNSHISPQSAKLRAQAVARVIYPYTQTIKMLFNPSLEEGIVIVEFLQMTPKSQP